jgi:ketosteroid isomerase-like protein
MSRENVEFVLESLRRAEANDLEGSAALMHPQIRGSAVRGWPEPGPFVGRDAVLAETKRLLEWGENRFTDIDVVADEGDWVVVAYRWHVRGAGSGIETHFDVAAAVRVKEGLVIEWHNRWNRDEAIEAAGLRDYAMSQENQAAIEAAYDAFSREGLDGFLGHWTDDLDHRSIVGAPDDRGPIHGKAAMRAYVQDWIDTFDGFRIEPVEVIEADRDVVVAVLRYGGRAKLSGIETDETFGVVFTIRDGKIARGREYATREEAVEAGGRRE